MEARADNVAANQKGKQCELYQGLFNFKQTWKRKKSTAAIAQWTFYVGGNFGCCRLFLICSVIIAERQSVLCNVCIAESGIRNVHREQPATL